MLLLRGRSPGEHPQIARAEWATAQTNKSNVPATFFARGISPQIRRRVLGVRARRLDREKQISRRPPSNSPTHCCRMLLLLPGVQNMLPEPHLSSHTHNHNILLYSSEVQPNIVHHQGRSRRVARFVRNTAGRWPGRVPLPHILDMTGH